MTRLRALNTALAWCISGWHHPTEHRARRRASCFATTLRAFFIKLLTQPGDLVLDVFAGSNTTGEAAESLGRRWLALECKR
ncbi:MAG TPA: DNA methyltransferase, partial [Pirellulales bacterium]|nr:DNA methyltransferase [Pirellulales bacterium]